jgi:alginate O-acetyltransferase complex protein AlgI
MFDWSKIGKLFLHQQDQPLLFHQGFFLLLFAVFLFVYALFLQKDKLRHLLLIVFSCYFYYKASGIFIVLLGLTISADYLFSFLIEKSSKKIGKWILSIGILFSISFLMYFKYRNFFLENTFALFGKEGFTPTSLILPIGISFYTFQSISYMVDIYQGKIQRPSFVKYLMYMLFFPHLVAGPIVRAKDFIPQLKSSLSITKENINEGLFLIIKGLVKKAIIADYVAQYSDIVFSAPDGFTGMEQLVATLCYTLQIFCDFSGYTDMAIGIALLLGYRLCLNFDSPYKSFNITQFWRKWHISLSSWLRDYIYIPLGGNRRGLILQLLFLLVTMLIGGFWHGADWKFVFWGASHGFLLIFHKLFVKWTKNSFNFKGVNIVSWLVTFSLAALLWVPFRANSMTETMIIYKGIFTSTNWRILPELVATNPYLIVALFVGYGMTLLPSRFKTIGINLFSKMNFVFKVVVLIVIIQMIIQSQSATVQPFIYFQF